MNAITVLVSCSMDALRKSGADSRAWQGATTGNSRTMARSRNAAGREKTPRIAQCILGRRCKECIAILKNLRFLKMLAFRKSQFSEGKVEKP
ncbi:MAG: hypothetical protein H0W33_00650 [Gammaproteobacteria bacterium]|nr:hypothetical protein [Gammaproteobacteria bacterium]